jgi:hypothetical protein
MHVSRKRETSSRKTQGGAAVRARLCTRRKDQGTESTGKDHGNAGESMVMDRRRVGKVWTTLAC